MDFATHFIFNLYPMHDLKKAELSELLDMLAQQTSRYVKMLSDGASKEKFDHHRKIITDIQAEIEGRRPGKSNRTFPSNDFYSQDHTAVDRPKG
jgi:hypothetical protein